MSIADAESVKCRVCPYPERLKIEMAIARGASQRAVAKTYGVHRVIATSKFFLLLGRKRINSIRQRSVRPKQRRRTSYTYYVRENERHESCPIIPSRWIHSICVVDKNGCCSNDIKHCERGRYDE